jgi:hypothetical protein
MAKWKYTMHEVTLANRDTVDSAIIDLNKAGQDGWEVVAWIPDPSKEDWGRLLLKSQA